jgi:hypothetical protein
MTKYVWNIRIRVTMLLVPIDNVTPFFSKDFTFGHGDSKFRAFSQERNPDERRPIAANIKRG